jgi:hypothetical protein
MPELAPWKSAELPESPRLRGLSWIGVCGLGVIVLGMSSGSGEFLLGPAVFVFASLHLLYLNTRLLPSALRPPKWRRVALVCMALFYGFFVTMVARSLLTWLKTGRPPARWRWRSTGRREHRNEEWGHSSFPREAGKCGRAF